jgi:hypothetical protein
MPTSGLHSTVVIVCASLVELLHGSYRFIHLSAMEFMRDWSDSLDELSNEHPKITQVLAYKAEAQSEITSDCH